MQPLVFSQTDRILVLAPHPDDETLAAGGLIQRAVSAQAAVRIVFITCGENNPWPQRAAFRHWFISDIEKHAWAQRRRCEALKALALLGLSESDTRFLCYPDGGLTELLMARNTALELDLAEELRTFRPTLLVAPSIHDLHPDHNTVALMASFAREHLAPPGVKDLRYRIHSRTTQYAARGDYYITLSESERDLKRRSVLAHGTQMILSRKRFLRYATGFELFVPGAEYQEAHPQLQLSLADTRTLEIHTTHTTLAGTHVYLVLKTGTGFHLTLPVWRSRATTIKSMGNSRVEVGLHMSRQAAVLTFPEEVSLEGAAVKVMFPGRFLDTTGWQGVTVRQNVPTPDANRVCCVIPCYNVAQLCGAVVREAARYADYVLAVDDGSSDDTRAILESIAMECPNVEVLVHETNVGKGAALLTAFHHALAHCEFDVLVTLDGDGQHRPMDIPRLASAVRHSSMVLAIGERDAFQDMPLRSRLGNEITGALLHLICPGAPKDTQCGLRGMSRDFVTQIVETIKGKRYETELHILLSALERDRGVASISIPTVYIEGNRSSHFNPLLDSLRIYSVLLSWWGRNLVLASKARLAKSYGVTQ